MKIKIFTLISALVLTLSFSCLICFANDSSENTASYEMVFRGDMNDDKNYSLKDALVILKMAAKVQPEDLEGDVNLDGVIDKSDALLMFNLALEKTGNYGMYTYIEPTEENVILVDCFAYSYSDKIYHTMQEAVDYVNANPPASEDERITILMAPGVYREQVTVTAPFITVKPMDNSGDSEVIFSYFYGNGNYYNGLNAAASASNAASFTIDKTANGFEAYDVIFENSYNIYLVQDELLACQKVSYDKINERFQADDATINQTQALAVRCAGDKVIFKNCKFYGRQDTLMFPKGGARAYLEDCYIEGTVDFIYADGTCVFNNCQINSPYGGGYITAACTPQEQPYGFLFYNCQLTRDAKNGKEAPAEGSYSLGRPWGQQAMVVYWNCKMDSHIKMDNDRFTGMGDATAEDARFYEVGSMDLNGNPLDLNTFVNADRETILTEADMTGDGEYAAWKWLEGKDGWNPAGFEKPNN